MDITTVFGTVIEGSNPPESTKVSEASLLCSRGANCLAPWGIRKGFPYRVGEMENHLRR